MVEFQTVLAELNQDRLGFIQPIHTRNRPDIGANAERIRSDHLQKYHLHLV